LVVVYPQARESVITFRPSRAPQVIGRRCSREPDGEPDGPPGAASTDRAVRRAKVTVRRYCKANGIDRLMTLTYAPPFCTDPKVLRHDVGRFVRRLRVTLGHRRFPYVWVPELHKDGTRLHAHIGLARYVKKADLQACWPHGFVDARRLRAKSTKAVSSVEHAGRAAHYLSKYVGKAFSSGAAVGAHRYEVGQGFQPRRDRIVLPSEHAARMWAIGQMGGEVPSMEWSSYESPDWVGPDCRVMFWS